MKKLKIGNVTYDLKLTTQRDSDLGDDCRGKIWYERLLISIDKELPTELKVQTFYHELAHAICEETSFNGMLMDKLGDNGYEIFVDNLGKAVYNISHNEDVKKIEDFLTEKKDAKTRSKSKNTRNNSSKD